MLELCLISFFLFIYDDYGISTDISKTVIMIFIIVMTVVY